MPQLDIITFFNQFFWLTVFFILFYFYFFKNLVPFLTRVIKVRTKKILASSLFVSNLKNHELITVSKSSDTFIIKTLSKISTIFNSFQVTIDSWCQCEVSVFQKNTQNLNQKFLVALIGVSSQPSIFTRFFVKKKLIFREDGRAWLNAFDCNSNFLLNT